MFGFIKRKPLAGWAEAILEGPVLAPEIYAPELPERLTKQLAANDFRIIMGSVRIIQTTRNEGARRRRIRRAEER